MVERTSGSTLFTPRILVVDDEKRIRDGCTAVLAAEGYEVNVAENGSQGLEMLLREHYDVVLLDLMMPGISGMEVLARVKTSHPDTAVIVITGYATVEHSIEAMKKGALDFIPKPFTPDQLRVVVAKAIEYTRTLQDIATEKSRLRVLVNHLADGVLATDAEKNVILANPAFVKMVGQEKERIIGHPVGELTDNGTVIAMLDEVLRMDQNEFVMLNREIASDVGGPEERYLSAQCLPFRDRQQRTLGTVTLLHDITTLKHMDRLKSDFVSMVSHEIRSPLNSVLMQFKVVLDGLAGELTEKQKEILSRVSDRLQGLVNLSTELLDLARIESGLITSEKELVDLAAIVRDQADLHRAAAEQKNITIHVQDFGPLPPVLANRQNMEEVFSNLISNAVKYSPEGAGVTLSAERNEDYLCIRVRDTGFGIPREELPRVFERFYRVKNEKTRHIVGTGLGLSIVKSILDAHNGRIKAESEEGGGTIFSVYLPVAAH